LAYSKSKSATQQLLIYSPYLDICCYTTLGKINLML